MSHPEILHARRRVVRRISLVVILVCVTVPVVHFVGISLVRAKCGAWSLIVGTQLKVLHSEMLDEWARTSTLPPSLALWVFEGQLEPDIYVGWRLCALWTSDDVRVGPYSLTDYRRGDVSLDQVRAASCIDEQSEWNLVGPFVISRDRRAHDTQSGGLIVGYQWIPNWRGENGQNGSFNVLFADNHVSLYGSPDDVAEMLARDLVVRQQHDLPPLVRIGTLAPSTEVD